MDLEVEGGAPQALYWVDGFDHGWHATLDGRAIPIHRANINFKAIEVPSGTHRIKFYYLPYPYVCALALFYSLFLLGGVVPTLYLWWKRQRLRALTGKEPVGALQPAEI